MYIHVYTQATKNQDRNMRRGGLYVLGVCTEHCSESYTEALDMLLPILLAGVRVLQCVAAVWCSGLQCVVVCCSVLQCVAVCCSESYTEALDMLLPILLAGVCVLQCVAVCCSVLQCVAMRGTWRRLIFVSLSCLLVCVCCSVLQQCVAVCCSVLKREPGSKPYCLAGLVG